MSSFRVQQLGHVRTTAPLNAVGQTLQIDCDPAGTALVQVLSTASLAGCTLVFEGRMAEDAPWIVLAAYVTNATGKSTVIAVTSTLTDVPANGWLVSLNGVVQFRVRVSAITAGSCHLGIRLSDTPHG